MLDAAQDLPDDIAELQAMVRASRVELRARDLLIERLRHQLEGLRRYRFGARSETLDQLELTLEDAEIAQALEKGAAEALTPDVPANAKRHPVRRPLPDHLPRHEQTLSPGEACGRCGGKLKKLGEDVTEELEFVPARFVVNRIVRPRMVCGCCETFHQAPLPSRPIERGRPGPGLLAHVLVSKYADHLPLYRQGKIYAREGVDLDRSTLADWVGKVTVLLEPLADAIGRHVLQGRAIFADDTPVNMLSPGTGKTKTARAWVYVRDGRARPHRRPSIASPATGAARTRKPIWPTSKAGCTPTAMRALKSCFVRGPSPRWPAWRTSGASSSTSTNPRGRSSPNKPSRALHGSMPSSRRRAASRRTNA
jgi:transposase